MWHSEVEGRKTNWSHNKNRDNKAKLSKKSPLLRYQSVGIINAEFGTDDNDGGIHKGSRTNNLIP